MRVCINPLYNPTDHTEGGIRRVVDAMVRYLPEHGIETTANPDGADLIVNHGTYNTQRPGVPSVAACHGLYWAGYEWESWAGHANRAVTDTMIAAQAITVPSQWVATAVTRGLWRPVNVVYHGVDAELWQPRPTRGYVLWNKARTDPVSNHHELDTIADRMHDTPFVSTYGMARENTRIIGPQPHDTMKQLVEHAGVYLQTAAETFGIGIIEAMAAGVPVAGWNYAGQSEIVTQGETGYLAPYGDYDALDDCIRRCLVERDRLSANARADVQTRWGWQDKIAQYAQIYKDVASGAKRDRPRVSVVITCYNLGKYLNHTVQSVIDQSMDDDKWECIIVDDRSTDDSYETARALVGYFQGRGQFNLQAIQTPQNLGLSGARNFGAELARGKYLIFLDADDMLTSNALTVLSDHLERNPQVDIAFGGLDTVSADGTGQQRNAWPDGTFSYIGQMAHQNQLSYASMMRLRVWKNLGGYRTRDWRAEDAGFWCRASSFGYHIAPATREATLIYRMRHDSKSGRERAAYPDVDGDWTAWFPWRLGAASGRLGTDLLAQTPKPELNIRTVPFGAQGAAPRQMPSWEVPHHRDPAVSIIIPVGPEHTKLLVDALDSVMAQTCPSWEVIVVYDNSEPLPVETFPWARFIYASGTDRLLPQCVGAGAARNVGLRAARAPLALFLDGDDVLRPNALEQMLSQYAAEGGYVYCDIVAILADSHIVDVATQDWRQLKVLDRGGRVEEPVIVPAAEWGQEEFLRSGYDGRPGAHSVTALVATVDALGVGGFDEKMTALEDWEFYMRFAASGITGHLIREPLLIYRIHTGTRREGRHANQKELEAVIRKRYIPFITGDMPMCSCGSGGGGVSTQMVASMAIAGMLPPEFETFSPGLETLQQYLDAGQMVRVRYTGDSYGAITYRGKVTRTSYRAGQEPAAMFNDVDPRDVEGLLLTGVFQVVQPKEMA